MHTLPCVTLNRYAQERAKKRHPWVFSNELADPKSFQRLEPGSLVDVLDCRGEYLGTGFVNPQSLIAVRILIREREVAVDQDFFLTRIRRAIAAREVLFGKGSGSESTYRAVFGEADGLPGLVIDRFQGAWVIEPHALGMFVRRGEIAAALAEFAGEEAILCRTDNRAAQLEGMDVGAELLGGKEPKEAFALEDGIRFPVDPLRGQKTGFFFDQRENRFFFRRWVEGAVRGGQKPRVLDLFCHSGAWGLRALKAGAAHATFVDSSASALEGVKAAAKELGFSGRITCIEGDALQAMKGLKACSYDAVALDPPTLIPSKKSAPQGSRAYRELNEEGFRLVAAGGVLSTSSCSYHMQEDRFEEVVAKAQLSSGREAQVLHRGHASADHPSLAGMNEGRYLKNLFLVVS
jgi:23S rRNA (cytosine1962-C5)-methyltransferase